jgi:hypothetical protein
MFYKNRGISSSAERLLDRQVGLLYMELVTLYAFIHVNNVDILYMSILLSTLPKRNTKRMIYGLEDREAAVCSVLANCVTNMHE